MPPVKIAALTMVYNEPDFVPIWVRHYAGLVGEENCTIIDHGSDDGCTEGLGRANVLHIPRSPQDDPRRADFISRLCASLLTWYDWVLYTDVDELLVPDPAHHASLQDLCAAAPAPVITALGFNIHHVVGEEPGYDPRYLVTQQRHFAMLTTSMFKPSLISQPVTWTPGFHTCDAPIVFAPLYLFHLRHVDHAIGLRRMARTRAMPWRYPHAGQHQKLTDEQWLAGLLNAARRPRREGVPFDLAQPPLSQVTKILLAQQDERKDETYKINIDMVVAELWRLPDRFIGRF